MCQQVKRKYDSHGVEGKGEAGEVSVGNWGQRLAHLTSARQPPSFLKPGSFLPCLSQKARDKTKIANDFLCGSKIPVSKHVTNRPRRTLGLPTLKWVMRHQTYSPSLNSK